jgi:hypothetical protein
MSNKLLIKYSFICYILKIFSSPNMKTIKNRKFNPPPQIIDLNGIIAEDHNNYNNNNNLTERSIHTNSIYKMDV